MRRSTRRGAIYEVCVLGAGTPRELEGMVHGGRFATTRIWMVDTATLGVVATFTP